MPAGLAYYGLQAELSQLQVVFLYSFLQETITYLTTMLAMRPPAKDAALQPGDAPAASDQQPAPVGPTEPQQGAALQPLLLLLDVQMDAPVISIPRHSTRCELRQHGEGRGAPGSADSIQAVRCAAMHSPQSPPPPWDCSVWTPSSWTWVDSSWRTGSCAWTARPTCWSRQLPCTSQVRPRTHAPAAAFGERA